jgi:hypothetical protein
MHVQSQAFLEAVIEFFDERGLKLSHKFYPTVQHFYILKLNQMRSHERVSAVGAEQSVQKSLPLYLSIS